MSSGACRALVALLLTLVATIVMTLPVAARYEELVEESTVTYTVNPSDGTIDVAMIFKLTTRTAAWEAQEWGPIIVENRAKPTINGQVKRKAGGNDVPGPNAPWKHIWVDTQRIPGGRSDVSFRVTYTLPASVSAGKKDMPARVDPSYIYVCVPGQDTDTATVKIKVKGPNWKLTQSGTTLEPSSDGFTVSRDTSGSVFTCIEGTRDNRLEPRIFIGPADREILLRAWQQDPGWLSSAESRSKPVLDDLHRFLGHDIPGESPLIVREAPARENAGGYASAHNTPGVVQLDEKGGVSNPEHQLAHAWFGKDNVTELWLREGMAEWIATAMIGSACETATSNDAELDLSDWLVTQPAAPANYEEIIAAQEAAACGIVSAVSARMPEAQWNEVLGSLLKGETKYIGTAGPEIGTSTIVDYREWLDAVDERGLVPAADDAEFVANMTDLDFAQNLLDEFGVPNDIPQLARRSEARAMYHQFLADAAPLGAPHAVRKDMDDWNFERAMRRLEKSYEVFTALTEANELLPEADLLPIVKPDFEEAKDESELDAVREWSQSLLEGAKGVAGPLGDLQATLPPGWTMPVAVRSAISDQRFDDIMKSITPAISAAQEISAANEALPQAGLLDKYEVRFENTATASKLDELTRDARSDRLDAERAGFALALLETEVGDWEVPEAVTRPLEQGQLKTGLTIVEDARVVISAAKAADEALPDAGLLDEIQELFEGVNTGAEMSALREQVETRRDDAVAVGTALATLASLVPDWKVPDVVADPVAAGDFAAAVATAAAAQEWIEWAHATNQALPEIDALNRIQSDFENAASLEELQEGADLAEDWAEAADRVALAIRKADEPRDMLTSFGLIGVNVEPTIAEAKEAAIAGEVAEALTKAAEVIRTIEGGSGAGSLRLAGIIFFGVAVIGVLGLWIMLRRQAGPSWARSTTPHWVEGGDKRGLLGRGKKKDDE